MAIHADTETEAASQTRTCTEILRGRGSSGKKGTSHIYFSVVKRLIAINHIQNKSFCLHNICVCSVYIYYVYINTHTCMYIFQKNVFFIYEIYLFII